MTRLYLFKGFLRVNAVLIVPSHARWVVLLDVRSQGFEDVVESVDPLYVFSVPGEHVSKLLGHVAGRATDFSLYSLMIRLP